MSDETPAIIRCWMAAAASEASGMLLGEAASKGDVAVVERWLEQGVKPEGCVKAWRR